MAKELQSLEKERGRLIIVRNIELKVAEELNYLSSQLNSDSLEISEEEILNKLHKAHNRLERIYAFQKESEELSQLA